MTTIQPRTKTVTIFQGDYLDEIEHLRRQVEAARDAEKDGPPRTLDEVAPSHELVEQHDALVREAEESAITVKVRNLGRRTYHDLKVKHPPRDDHDADEAMGANEETFFDELVALCLVQPTFDTDTERQRFLEDLAPIDWERVKLAAFAVNEHVSADPKLFGGSKPTTVSDAT